MLLASVALQLHRRRHGAYPSSLQNLKLPVNLTSRLTWEPASRTLRIDSHEYPGPRGTTVTLTAP
ncbi:MAG: hypothetical protein AB1758_29720 [Candidatus Eremiobacterota bacterium]